MHHNRTKRAAAEHRDGLVIEFLICSMQEWVLHGKGAAPSQTQA
jgi:hypothetical protein